jgi:hypothetical protein
VACAEESQRRGARAAVGLGRCVGAARVGGGTGKAAAAVTCGGVRWQGGSSVGRRSGVARSRKASRKGLRPWASPEATRGGQERQGASGGAAEGEQRKKRGAPGAKGAARTSTLRRNPCPTRLRLHLRF